METVLDRALESDEDEPKYNCISGRFLGGSDSMTIRFAHCARQSHLFHDGFTARMTVKSVERSSPATFLVQFDMDLAIREPRTASLAPVGILR